MLEGRDLAVVRQSVLFSGLPEGLRAQLIDRCVYRTFSRGETIFLRGEPARFVFIVLEGWVKLFRISRNGAEAVVGVFTKGDSFGEAVAFRDDTYPVDAEAATDARVLQVRAADCLEMMRTHPELCIAILSATFTHLHELVGQIEQLKAHTGAQRVAEFLVEICPCEEGACTVTLPYDKSLIAGRLGMKPESLSRSFARLRAHGVRVEQNQATVADVALLRNYVEEDPAAAWSKAQ